MAQLQAGRPTSPADGYVQPLLPDKEDEVQLEQIRYVALTIKCLTWLTTGNNSSEYRRYEDFSTVGESPQTLRSSPSVINST
jgi:hypothetical protein